MKTLLFITITALMTNVHAAIIAEPVFELKKSEIRNVSIKVIYYANQTKLIKLIGINDYKSFCEMGDRKLKKIEIIGNQRVYEIYNYKTNSQKCTEALNEQTKTYLIDSFKLNQDENLPTIIINGRILNGEKNEG